VSTVVLTLVVVGGSIAVAAKLAASGERKPATAGAGTHRASSRGDERPVRQWRRRATAAPGGAAAIESVAPRPGLFTRLRAGVTLVAIVAVIGASIALGLLAGAEVVSRALETAVQ
jgi:hypothetical protein